MALNEGSVCRPKDVRSSRCIWQYWSSDLVVTTSRHVRYQRYAHNWFNSYLSDRTQRVNKSGVLSNSKRLTFGCTWTYFLLYVHQTSFWHSSLHLTCHPYDDDTQLYVIITKDREHDVVGNMETFVAEFKIWMTNNMLKLNYAKTELFVFALHRQRVKYKYWQYICSGEFEQCQCSLMWTLFLVVDIISWETFLAYTTQAHWHR